MKIVVFVVRCPKREHQDEIYTGHIPSPTNEAMNEAELKAALSNKLLTFDCKVCRQIVQQKALKALALIQVEVNLETH